MVAGCTGPNPARFDATNSSQFAEPPPLVVVTPTATIQVPGYDYCWGDNDSEAGTCADWFGSETPTRVTVDTPMAAVQWIEGADLSSRLLLGEGECLKLLESSGPGEWVLTMPPTPGTYRVNLSGTSGDWTSNFAIMLTSTVDGPAARPYAEIEWPNTTNKLAPLVVISGAAPDTTVKLRFLSTDAIVTTFGFEGGGGDSCRAEFPMSGETSTIYNKDIPGESPYTVTLIIESQEGRFTATWRWPDDLTSDGMLVGSTEPAND